MLALVQLIPSLYFFALVALFLALCSLVLRQQRHRGNQPRYRSRAPKPKKASGGVPNDVLSLLQGDRGAADRLFRSVSVANPHQSGEWCWDKVVRDLERDRH